MTKPYRTIYVGTLLQESFLSLGGTDDPYSTVDAPFCRDGLARPTLRGSSIAGALVASLRRTHGSVPPEISGSSGGEIPSVWRTFHSHPDSQAPSQLRQHVAIDYTTGAATEEALFNLETLPPGTRWPLVLEVDTSRMEDAAELAEAVLAQWQRGRCWLGREVARGLGWMRLIDLKRYRLTTSHADDWPNAFSADSPAVYLRTQFADRASDIAWLPETGPVKPMLELSGSVIAGEHPDGYGIDSLSVGGHEADTLFAQWSDFFLCTEGEQRPADHFDPDTAVVCLPANDEAEQLPYIPGSTLRGPLRHALRRLLVARNQPLAVVDSLFGTADNSARLLICDLMPEPETPISMAWLQQHAEDEFAGSTYESAKFDRVMVLSGRFRLRMVLEAENHKELKTLYDEGLCPLLELVGDQQIGLGGGQWRGNGWLRWKFMGNPNVCGTLQA